MNKNIKTVNRLFTVLGVIVSVLIIQFSVSPLTFALDDEGLILDQNLPTLMDYPFGLNSVIIDVIGGRSGETSGYRRIIIDGQSSTFSFSFPDGNYNHFYLSITSFGSEIWQYTMSGAGVIASYNDYQIARSSRSVSSSNKTVIGTYSLNSTTHTYSRTYNDSFYLTTTSSNSHVYLIVSRYANTGLIPNSSVKQFAYPAGVGGLTDSDLNKLYSHMDENRDLIIQQFSVAGSEANSRQSQIMDAGSDVTVSTIDNWVAGENGLAGKLTNLAATLSSNAAIFSQNQSENQANLQRAGDFVKGVFDQIPTGIIAACLCFLIMLIAVKVVGR